MGPFETFVTFSFGVVVYMLPGVIAAARKHHQRGAIQLLNLLLGWTGLGWIVALVWSVSAVRKPAPA